MRDLSRHVGFVPKADIRIAAKHLVSALLEKERDVEAEIIRGGMPEGRRSVSRGVQPPLRGFRRYDVPFGRSTATSRIFFRTPSLTGSPSQSRFAPQ